MLDDRNTRPLSHLAGEAAAYDAQVASMIGDDDDMIEYLTRLEQLTDDDSTTTTCRRTHRSTPTHSMEEVEQFLTRPRPRLRFTPGHPFV